MLFPLRCLETFFLTTLWCVPSTERFDEFRAINDVIEEDDAFGKALMHDYHQELIYVDGQTQEQSEVIPVVEVRQLVRDGVLTDEMNVWTAAFANWATLSETRWQFGLAEVMMAELPIESEDTVSDGPTAIVMPPSRPREKKEDGHQSHQKKPREKMAKVMDLTATAALKLSSLCAHAGFLCATQLKATSDGGSEVPEDGTTAGDAAGQSASDELREAFAEFDSDGSGQLDRAEITEAMQKALGSIGKQVTGADLDHMMKEMDGDDSGEIGFEEFAEWWKTQADSCSSSSKMVKYWAMVVSVNADGMATKPEATGRRAIVFYSSKTALRPVGHVLSTAGDDGGLFELSTPDLSMKLVMRYPHCFACSRTGSDGDGNDGQAPITLAARAAGDRANWMALLRDRSPFPQKDQIDPRANASDIERIFREIDEDGSGVLDKEEMGKLFARMGKKLDDVRLTEIFSQIDSDGGGEVEIGEFEQWWDTDVDPPVTALIRADVGFFSFEQILACVRRTGSPYNWMLALPPAAASADGGTEDEGAGGKSSQRLLYKAGSLGFPEASEWLDDSRVLYALARVGFGAGSGKGGGGLQSKVAFIRCIGVEASAEVAERDTADAVESRMRELLEVKGDDMVLTMSRKDLATAAAFAKRVAESLTDADERALFSAEAVEMALQEERTRMGGLDPEAQKTPKHQQKEDKKAKRAQPESEPAPETTAAASSDVNAAVQSTCTGATDDDSEGEDEGNSGDDDMNDDKSDDDSGEDSSEYDSSSEETDSDEDFDSDDDEYERVRTLPTLGREVTGVKLVVDQGYGATRFGICGESAPTGLANMLRDEEHMRYMIERQKLESMAVDWEALETQWFQMFETELDVEGENCSVLATISPYGSKEYAETLAELLFETFDVNSIYFANPSMLSLYAQGKMTGLVLDSGECITSAFPVFEGTIDKHAVKSIPFGGRDVTEYVKRQMSLDMDDYATNRVACRMKEELCYCGEPRAFTEVQTYSLPDGGEIRVEEDSPFPYRAPEFFFFDPMRLDWEDTSLEQSVQAMIMEVVAGCAIDTRKKLTENLLLAGSNTLFDGLPEMMFKKVKAEGKARCGTLKMAAPKHRSISAWLGAHNNQPNAARLQLPCSFCDKQ